MDHNHQLPVHHSSTASRMFNGEAVVITPAANMVRLFNPTGSRIWELIDGQHNFDDIVSILVEEFDVDPDRARLTTTEFFAMLEEKRLIEWREG